MKKLGIFLTVLFFLISFQSQAQIGGLVHKAVKMNKKGGFIYEKVKIDSVPTTVPGFIEMRNKLAKKPMGGAAMFLLALKVYSENPKLGNKFLVLTVTKSRLAQGDAYKGYDIVRVDKELIDNQLHKQPYLPNSYIKGATPSNNYNVSLPYIYKMTYDKSSFTNLNSDRVKVYVISYGADRHRPIWMRKNDKGIWKAEEWGSIIVGIRPAAKDQDTDEL